MEFYKQLKSKRKRSLLIRHMVVEFIHSILGVDLREVVLMEKEAGREEGWGGGAVGVGGEQEAGHQDNSLPPEK